MVSYTTVVGGLMIGTIMVAQALADLAGSYQAQERVPLLWINPVYMMGIALNTARTGEDVAHLMAGLLFYAMASAGLLTLMIVRFRNATD
jgi:hypothetical protein